MNLKIPSYVTNRQHRLLQAKAGAAVTRSSVGLIEWETLQKTLHVLLENAIMFLLQKQFHTNTVIRLKYFHMSILQTTLPFVRTAVTVAWLTGQR